MPSPQQNYTTPLSSRLGYCCPITCIASGHCRKMTPIFPDDGVWSKRNLPNKTKRGCTMRHGWINPKANIANQQSGSVVSGNIRFVMMTIFKSMWIISTSIRSNMAMLIASVTGRILHFIAMFDPVSIKSIGRNLCQKPVILFAGNSLR